jgi:hypothetical protein
VLSLSCDFHKERGYVRKALTIRLKLLPLCLMCSMSVHYIIQKNFKHQRMHKEFFSVNYDTLLHVSTLLGHLQGETFRCRYTRLHYTVERECAGDCALRRSAQKKLFVHSLVFKVFFLGITVLFLTSKHNILYTKCVVCKRTREMQWHANLKHVVCWCLSDISKRHARCKGAFLLILILV